MSIILDLFSFLSALICDAHNIPACKFVDDESAELLGDEIGHLQVVDTHIESYFKRTVGIF